MIPAPYAGPRFFFLHVMKTAGGTFANYLRSNFPKGSVYPAKGVEADLEAATYDIPTVLGLPVERRRSIAVYTGHFPSVVADLMGEDLTRITILREPVERAISYLRHCRTYHPQHRDLSLEAIYEDAFYNDGFIHEHQVKQFAFTAADPLSTYFQHLDVDGERLELARRNLDRVDVIGLAEELPALVSHVQDRFGWGPLKRTDVHVSADDAAVPDSLRRRIAEDNPVDLEFYEHARRLVDMRAREGRHR